MSRAHSNSEFCSKLDGLLQEAMSRNYGWNCCVMGEASKVEPSINCCAKPLNCLRVSRPWQPNADLDFSFQVSAFQLFL